MLIGALALAIITAGAAAVVAARARRQADDRVAEAVATLAAGMQETMRELRDAAEAGAEPAGASERYATELAASLDLEQVTERTLAAASSIPGVDAAFLDGVA